MQRVQGHTASDRLSPPAWDHPSLLPSACQNKCLRGFSVEFPAQPYLHSMRCIVRNRKKRKEGTEGEKRFINAIEFLLFYLLLLMPRG